MARDPLPLSTDDLSAFTRALSAELAKAPAPPGHLALMNMLARAAGFRNVQHLRADHAAARRMGRAATVAEPADRALVERTLNTFDATGRMMRWPARQAVQDLAIWAFWARLPSKRSLTEAEVNTILDDAHLFGDRAILRMCQLLKRVCRTSDTVVRWGGDEFMVIARRIPLEAAQSLAERIRRAVPQERIELDDGRAVRLSCSIGFAFFPFIHDEPERLTWEQTIGIADRALYVAKMNGRDAWACLRATDAADTALDYERLIEETEMLVDQGSVAISTSIAQDQDLVWERVKRVRTPRDDG